MTGIANKNALGAAGMEALQAGDAAEARRCFRIIIQDGQADLEVWLAMALACNALGIEPELMEALDNVLARDPRNLRALVMKGDALFRAGEKRAGATFYSLVTQMHPSEAGLPPPAATEVARIRQVLEDHKAELSAHIRRQLDIGGHISGAGERFVEALELLEGKRERFVEQPRALYFPGMPARQFYNPAEFDWVDGLQAAASDIRKELDAALKDESGFTPYVHATGNTPINPDHPLLDNEAWSALFLIREGEIAEEAARQFPMTMQALEPVPLETLDKRAPSVLVSRLLPGARIDAHRGFLNTRLTCHLPLIVPENCAIRVGNETRSWREGEVMIFNDAINHEAWNDSDQNRYVLIFHVWRPEISPSERVQLAALLKCLNDFDG